MNKNNKSQRRFLAQHSVATLLRHCFNGCSIVPALQRCVALKLLQDRFDVGGKTLNIAIQLFLQQCYKTPLHAFCCYRTFEADFH